MEAVRRRSSRLRFQSFVVVVFPSFLPDCQRKGGQLARQSKAHEGRTQAFLHPGLKPVVPRAGPSAGFRGHALEQPLQLRVMVAIQTAKSQHPLRALHPTAPQLILPADARLEAQPEVGPELPLGAETMRCADDRDQDRRPYRAQKWDGREMDGGGMLAHFAHQFLASLPAQPLLTVELFVKPRRPAAGSHFAQLLKPIVTVTRTVDSLPRAADRSPSVDSLQPA